MNRFYAGIGSRETPTRVLNEMRDLGEYLANRGYTLRSGHAPGADQAFEDGCDRARGPKEIYLPEKGWLGSDSQFFGVDLRAMQIAAKFHPVWHRLSDKAKTLHGRNTYQIFGFAIAHPVKFVVCWTPGGREQGGTAQAMRIARHYEIPVYNLATFNLPMVQDKIEEKHA